MAYNVIKSEEISVGTEELKVVKYAILEKEEKYYLQLKIKNVSDKVISSFTLVYLDNGDEKELPVNYMAAPQQEFFGKNIIQLINENANVISIKDIAFMEENYESQEETPFSLATEDSDKPKEKKPREKKPGSLSTIFFIVLIVLIGIAVLASLLTLLLPHVVRPRF